MDAAASPTTPTRRRRSSTANTLNSRRSSHHGSPTHHRRTSSRLSNFDNSLLDNSMAGAPDSGLGNLEDELADAWDEDEGIDDSSHLDSSRLSLDASFDPEKIRDSGIDVSSNPPASTPTRNTPTKQPDNSPSKSRNHARQPSAYDGSEYGPYEPPPEELPASLKAAMADIEGLAKASPAADNDIIPRTIEALRDLGNQSMLESSATRLATAHTALSTHMTHQTRVLQTVAYTLLSPLSMQFGGPDDELIDELIPLLTAAIESTPQPTLTALQSVGHLTSSTKETVSTLSALSDNLHMSRQVSEAASRRLKSAREVLGGMVRENTLAEQGSRYVEEGGWDRKLRERDSARVCQDVVSGFEEVCNGWREQLVRSLDVESVAAG